MSNFAKNREIEEKSPNEKGIFSRLIPGRNMNRNKIAESLPFIVFLTFWAIIYIANRHYAEKTERYIDSSTKKVRELRADYLTIKAELMFTSKQSEIANMVENMGLYELKTPPGKIFIKK